MIATLALFVPALLSLAATLAMVVEDLEWVRD